MLTGSFPWEQATLSDPNYYEFVQCVKDRDEGFARIAEIVALESLIKISS
jgi:hypothetical protein